jgi:hypothetical protein
MGNYASFGIPIHPLSLLAMQESFLASVFSTPALALAPPPLAGVQT